MVPERHGHGIIHVLTSPLDHEGVLTRVEGLEEVRSLPGVADAEVVIPVGGVVRPFTGSGNKLGYVVVTGDSSAEAKARLARVVATLSLVIEPSVPQTS